MSSDPKDVSACDSILEEYECLGARFEDSQRYLEKLSDTANPTQGATLAKEQAETMCREYLAELEKALNVLTDIIKEQIERALMILLWTEISE